MNTAPIVQGPSLRAPPLLHVEPAAEQRGPDARRDNVLSAVCARAYYRDAEFNHYAIDGTDSADGPLRDFLFAVGNEPHLPDEVFSRLRWGGQFVYASRDRAHVAALAERFPQRGFQIMRGPEAIRVGLLPWPLFSRKYYFLIARKVFLIRPREITDRFTYHVQLVPNEAPDTGFVVMKEIPSVERVIGRLRARFTDLPLSVLEKRALNFTEKIFPLFLTREAAMLKVIERDVPREYADCFPRVLGLQKDSRGYVRRLWMNWLRNGGQPLSQLEFARQCADLLRVLHDEVGIIHLDLRLDNIVITEHGVGFVDFGSGVCENENIAGNPLLSTLFDELMRTSQIQRMLEKMKNTGTVTSSVINNAHHKVDKAVDLFYLAVQLNSPHTNPDLRDLITYNPESLEAKRLSRLTGEILTPADPNNPPYRCAQDVLAGIEELKTELNGAG